MCCICVTCCIHTCEMTHPYVWHCSSNCATWLLRMCCRTPSYVCGMPYAWHDFFMSVAWRIHMCGMYLLHVWDETCPCRMCDMSLSYLWRVIQMGHVPFVFVTCHSFGKCPFRNCGMDVWRVPFHIRVCNTFHSCGWHFSFTCVTRLICVCVVSNSSVWHSRLGVGHFALERVTCPTPMWPFPFMHENCAMHTCNSSPSRVCLMNTAPLYIYANKNMKI